jgi:hypothetical protein
MMPSVAERRSPYSLKAPGGRDSDGAPMRLPGRTPFPNVADHLVQPEVTRDEMIGDRLVVALPAKEPHADLHSELDHVLRAHAAPPLRPNDLAAWELRLGAFRVFYEVDPQSMIVWVKAIGRKEHNRLLIRGKEVLL